MAEHPNATLHRKVHEAFTSQDLKTVNALVAEDAVFRFSAVGPLSGEYRGRDAVLSAYQQLAEQFKEGVLKGEGEDYLGSDERSIALGRFMGTRGDRTMDVRMVEVIHWRDGKVAERWALFDDQDAIREFWS